MEHRSRTINEHRARAAAMLKSGGHPHPDAAEDKALIKQELRSHVKPEALTKLARGGPAKGKKGVTIVINHGQDPQAAKQEGLQRGLQAGAAMAAHGMGTPPGGVMPPRPPMAGPPPGPQVPPPGAGGPPPGAMPPGGPGSLGHWAGGNVKVRAHVRRKKGGACE